MVNHNLPTRKPHDWVPPVPGFSAKVDEPVTIAYYGVQSQTPHGEDKVAEFRQWCSVLATGTSAPVSRDCAEYVDENGYYTWVSIFYWKSEPEVFTQWTHRHDYTQFWDDPSHLEGSIGYFREVLHIPNQRLETLYSATEDAVGVGATSGTHEGPVQAHNYWGSMRDRIPDSANSSFEPEYLLNSPRKSEGPGFGQRVLVDAKTNLCTIRSGEDFSELVGREHDVFHNEIEPLLREGMLYLRDNPAQTGCYSCRHMTQTTAEGVPLQRGFATAHFDSLTRLEDWAESHPTHLKIFGRFIEMATELKGEIKLKLWHEVTVAPETGQEFEYINCDPRTGLLPYDSVTSTTPRQEN